MTPLAIAWGVLLTLVVLLLGCKSMANYSWRFGDEWDGAGTFFGMLAAITLIVIIWMTVASLS